MKNLIKPAIEYTLDTYKIAHSSIYLTASIQAMKQTSQHFLKFKVESEHTKNVSFLSRNSKNFLCPQTLRFRQ